jgi:hypothetical protein
MGGGIAKDGQNAPKQPCSAAHSWEIHPHTSSSTLRSNWTVIRWGCRPSDLRRGGWWVVARQSVVQRTKAKPDAAACWCCCWRSLPLEAGGNGLSTAARDGPGGPVSEFKPHSLPEGARVAVPQQLDAVAGLCAGHAPGRKVADLAQPLLRLHRCWMLRREGAGWLGGQERKAASGACVAPAVRVLIAEPGISTPGQLRLLIADI